jgi:hypothetical protein
VSTAAGTIGAVSWPPKIGELLPDAERAYGIHEKLAQYSLKPGHPRRKAEAFAHALAVTVDDLEFVADALLAGVRATPVSGVRAAGPYGFHCEVIVHMRGLRDRADRVANVLTAWQIRWDGDPPRLITAYIVSRVR